MQWQGQLKRLGDTGRVRHAPAPDCRQEVRPGAVGDVTSSPTAAVSIVKPSTITPPRPPRKSHASPPANMPAKIRAGQPIETASKVSPTQPSTAAAASVFLQLDPSTRIRRVYGRGMHRLVGNTRRDTGRAEHVMRIAA